jgi:hypothetical protein
MMKFKDIDKLKSQSQKRFNERKYQYLKYKNKNHSGSDTQQLSDINLTILITKMDHNHIFVS